MVDRYTKANSSQIKDDSLLPVDFASTNSPSDNQILTYDVATGKFTWESQAGGGDMAKATYDTDDDGIVDKAETIDDGAGNSASAVDVKDAVTKKHSQNTDTGTSGDSFQIGDGTDTTKYIYANNGDATKPGLRYNSSTNKWEFSNDGTTWIELPETSGGGTPTGAYFPFAGSSAPSGYLLMYGQAVSRTTEADLFAVIGTTYGVGDGSTTFNLPDMRGRVPVGKDNMGGASANRVTDTEADSLGGSFGAEKHTLTSAELASHTHGIKLRKGNASTGSASVKGNTNPFDYTFISNSAGSNSAHNNLQPSLTGNYIIKT